VSTFSFIDDLSQWSFLRSKKIRDHNGHTITLFNRVFQGYRPFSKNDFFIRTYPSVEDLITKIKKLLPKKPNFEKEEDRKLKDAIDKCIKEISRENGTEQAFQIAKKYFKKIDSDLVRAGPMFKTLAEMGYVHHWTCVTFQPYLDTIVDLQDLNQLNTFMGFHLLNYQPEVEVNIKDTHIWEYLYHVWGWKGEKMKQLDGLLDLVAWKLQNPNQRSHRIMMMISEEQGTGKTFFYEGILVMVFGAMYCNFHDSLDGYLCNFNITDASRLHIWVDDLQSTCERKTKRIYPKVTCTKQEYEKKNETKISLSEFSELWMTSNSYKPLYTTPEERRQLYFWASPYKLQDRTFFKKAYAEAKNLAVGKAFFEFFRDRDVSKFNPQDNPNQEIKTRAQLSSIPVPLAFILEFFCQPEWYLMYKPPHVDRVEWLKLYNVKKTGLRISKTRLYKLYEGFSKAFYSNSRKLNQNTFYDDHLRKYGINPVGRVHLNGKGTPRTVCVDIDFNKFRKIVEQKYKGYVVPTWIHVEDFDEFKKEYDKSPYTFCV
jgi:hypothetical protein